MHWVLYMYRFQESKHTYEFLGEEKNMLLPLFSD